MVRSIETVIVGGGQAGLATSYYLSRLGREHVILEKEAHIVSGWRDGRWDSFCLVTPNWTVRMPGAEYAGPDPQGFMPLADVLAYFDAYRERFGLPVEYGVTVSAVDPHDGGYRVQTGQGDWQAKNVVMASGFFQTPKMAAFHTQIPADILQITSGQYRSAQALPPGAVLVVGSGQSGAQIAEELYQAGRRVYLATGTCGRSPRRYRGRDVFEWLYLNGFLRTPVEKLPSPKAKFSSAPHFTGKGGGRTLNLHRFYRDGVVLLGHARDYRDGKLVLAPDLKENLAKSDGFEANLTKMIDGFIGQSGLDAPEETLPELKDGYAAEEILSLDLKAAGVSVIIWALGFRFDYSLVHLPLCDEDGFPVTANYRTNFPGLYFVGLPYLDGQITGLLMGVGMGAARVAGAISGEEIVQPAIVTPGEGR